MMGRSQQHFLSSSSSSSLTRSFTRLGSLFLNRLGNSNLCWRTCQLVVMTTTLVSLYTFILVFISVTSMTRHQKNRPITWLRRDQLQMPPESHLIDLIDFDYVLQPKGLCHHRNGQREKDQSESQEIYFIIYVHSAPGNSQERQLIRSTWGSVKRILKWDVKVIFLLGLSTPQLQSKLTEEQQLNGDLVQGNFIDSYRNLTYKHLMGYKWILTNCPQTTYIVKVDDDSFVDVIQLFQLMNTIYGDQATGVLACSVWPAGSTPQREQSQKWAVNWREYPYDFYPAYCGGLAYVVSPDVARDLLAASRHLPFFWIDDLYVTGLLAEMLPHIRHHSLNLRTTYDLKSLLNWLKEAHDRPCPFIFGDVSDGNRTAILNRLWQKCSRIWKSTSYDTDITRAH